MSNETEKTGPTSVPAVGGPVLSEQLGLVEKLRDPAQATNWGAADNLMNEAAAEIESLQSQLVLMRTLCELYAEERNEARAAVAAERERFRAALLGEAAEWTGDFRVPVHQGLCDAAERAGVPLTLDECYQATKKA